MPKCRQRVAGDASVIRPDWLLRTGMEALDTCECLQPDLFVDDAITQNAKNEKNENQYHKKALKKY